MVLQQDNAPDGPQGFDSGLPRVQTSEDVPRWLVILGLVAGLTLFVALLRYAIDLLGVVFLIIVVGFSIRALSDWLTEGESVSLWALAAVSGGLFGTLTVALWLFGSHDRTASALERKLPQPVLSTVDWLEDHGWGQRVLLSSGGLSSPSPGPATASAPKGAASSPAAGAGGEIAVPRAAPLREVSPPHLPGRPTSARKGGRQSHGEPGVAEAATLSPAATRGARTPGTAAAGPADATTSTAGTAPETMPAVVTEVTLRSSQASALVGTGVRLTATVHAATGAARPSGVVVFFRGGSPLGRVPVRLSGDGLSVATLTTLSLPIGTHELTAVFEGAPGFGDSRSAPLVQVVRRH